MNRLERLICSMLAIALAVFSLQAIAESPMIGRDFDHMTTGFPLLGGHATTPCETCHVAGVFKGTAKACDGCHALGRRVVATPKNVNHVVTDAPCDTCHFNNYTFLGATYNHGTVQPGQCTMCHNGNITTGRPASSHSAGLKLTGSCDNCHRTYAFLPATWNHVGVLPGTCANAGCHVQGSNQYYREKHVYSYGLMRTNNCDDCHNFVTWTPRHIAQTKLCSGCHNDVDAKGPLSFTGHMTIPAGVDCQACHASTTTASTSWVGGGYNHAAAGVILGAGTCSTGSGCHGTGSTNRFTAASHIYSPKTYTLMMTTPGCDSCHLSFSIWTPPTHITPTGTCNSCHDDVQAKGPASYAGHTTVGTTVCTLCHTKTTASQSSAWAGASGGAPAGHTYTGTCTNCHPTSGTTYTGATLHAQFGGATCASCHLTKGLTYTLNNPIQTKNHNQPKDCAASGCHAPGGNVGSAYTQWN
jgi:hypothetical protein